ncbi:MSH2 protein [Tilletia horrida]|uniref:DNA mismatch repair protein MSH2 n=1 Tax=Tilletia horrida TaxID=155126 RepID=A0AAN6GPI9_9BASI|nr:MSH2 protein [Tilletia horrida]
MYSSEDREKPVLDLDTGAQSGFCAFFKSMPEAQDGTVRLFDRGDFFSAHGKDAILVANAVFKTQSVLKYLGSNNKEKGLASCTLGHAAARAFLTDALTARQMRVEIWANGGGKRNNSWSISKQATPGNLQGIEDLLFVNTDILSAPIVMAIKIKIEDGIKHIGAAYADASNRSLGVSEYAENDLFSNTESLLIQLGVKECLLPEDKGDDYDLKKLRSVVDRCGCIITDRKKALFTGKSIETDLGRLLSEDSSKTASSEFEKKIAMGAANALLSYLDLGADDANFGKFTLSTHDLSQYLRLDSSAVRALNLFPEPGQTGYGKNTSLYGLLNYCKTAQGVRMLAQWLKQPLVNAHLIRERQDLVEIFVEDSSTRQNIQTDELRYLPDLHRISKRLQRGIATLEDVVRVYQAIMRLPRLIELLTDAETPSQKHVDLLLRRFTSLLQSHKNTLQKFSDLVEATLDLDELANHHYVVKADFREDLRQIRDELDEVRDSLDNVHRQAGKDLKLDIEKKLHLENHNVHGYCLRVTRSDSGVIKGKAQFSEIATVKGGLYFTTSKLRGLNDRFARLNAEYSEKQSGVVKEVVSIAASYCSPLEQLNVVIAELDVIVSFAHISVNAVTPYVKPQLHERGTDASLLIKDGRHPCLEMQDEINFIPNDTEMKVDESEFLVITGPNMGGKSTYIRQVGVIALMAQSGCFVPAAEGVELPIFDCILARVGAGDSQLKGVSTFMAEMLETATILKTATKDSLIIIDELGRGTSTYDGFGLAWAISEWITTKIRCKTLFATHFHELTNLAAQQSHVKNLHVVAHVSERKVGDVTERDIDLLYRVEPGISDQSYGIHVAELAHFPPSVIKLAKRKAEELENFDDEAAMLDMDEDLKKEGTELIQEFQRTLAARLAAVEAPVEEAMDSEDAEAPALKRRKTASDPQAELRELRRTVDEFRERMEAQPWTAKILSTAF